MLIKPFRLSVHLLLPLAVVVCIPLVFALFSHTATTQAQGDTTSFHGLLERLINQKEQFFVSF